MSLLDKFSLPPAIARSVEQYGVNPVNLPFELDGSATEATLHGQPVVLAGTNNYLGLTFEHSCIEASVAAVRREGTGTTGSRMANGTYGEHLALEEELRAFFDARAAMVFTTGYQANLGMISALAGPDDVILLDADSHASVYDGARLSGAQVYRFRHNDVASLERRLQRLGAAAKRCLVVVEGLYSMLGDRAPLAGIVAVKERYGALLLVDEAHSMGVMGATGRGRAEEDGVLDRVDFVVGTFSKSLGSVGGYCVSPLHDLEPMRPAMRSYMFTASAAPSVVASARAALQVLQAKPELRLRLWRNAHAVYQALTDQGFSVGPEPSPVVAVMLHDADLAVAAWHALLADGVYVNLVLPPASPGSFSLLRCSMSAAHTPEQVTAIIAAFARVKRELLPERRQHVG